MIEPFIPGTDYGTPSSQLDAPESDPQSDARRAGRAIERETRTPVIFRHSGWARNRSLIAASLARTQQPESRQSNFWDCGAHSYVLESVDRPGTFRIAGSACHDRFCVPCAQERAYVIAGNVLDAIRNVEVRFLTLTIKTDGETLAESLDKLYRSFAAIRRRRWFRKRVWGGVAMLELKRCAKTNRWHPHLHCLVTGTWVDKFKLSRLWHEVTGDSFIVDIQRPKNDEDVSRYVTKYVTKVFSNAFLARPELIDEAILAMKGRKLALTWGKWRGLLLTESPDDGAWEHVASLETIIDRAAGGDTDSLRILESLTRQDLGPLLARAPPPTTHPAKPTPTQSQTTWLGTWQHDGTYRTDTPF